ncbi:hypothetical protein FJT64_000079 [Amphibalanus amphitrite]|uniref:Uncharacterized protein n=1 Tax=Amphibalanus amphitrite TaxID=1232801 RepID=A0A6A4XEA5_AMPAM|nr:hypothetical protein FJT64_000079 [Amphibalanus amphitrite]
MPMTETPHYFCCGLYADDTAALSGSCRMETARERAQIAADTMVRWANRWKMVITGEKTQALVLSQWSHDTPEHVLLRCPCLAGARLRLTGNIHIRPEKLKDGELVAALAAGYLRHKEPLMGLQAGPGRP